MKLQDSWTFNVCYLKKTMFIEKHKVETKGRVVQPPLTITTYETCDSRVTYKTHECFLCWLFIHVLRCPSKVSAGGSLRVFECEL